MKRQCPAVFCLLCLSLSLPLWSQEVSSIYDNLDKLELLLLDTLNNSEAQSRQLADLNRTLTENGQIMNEREVLLSDLRTQLNEMSETFRKQSLLSEKYERNSKFWKRFTLIGIPVTAVISAGVVAAVMLGR